MSRLLSTALAAVLLLAVAAPVAASGPDTDLAVNPTAGEVVPGEVIVKWRDSGKGPEVARAHGLSVLSELGTPAAPHG